MSKFGIKIVRDGDEFIGFKKGVYPDYKDVAGTKDMEEPKEGYLVYMNDFEEKDKVYYVGLYPHEEWATGILNYLPSAKIEKLNCLNCSKVVPKDE